MKTILFAFVSFVALFVVINGQSDLLVPNYDNADYKLKHFKIRNPLILSCNVTEVGEFELVWEKNGTQVSEVKSLEGRFKIIKPEGKFIIEKTEKEDAGIYSCRVNTVKKIFRVVADVVVHIPSNTAVVEGEKLSIHCVALGTEPRLYWEIGNLTIYNSTGRYILKPDENMLTNAILTMDNVGLDDRGDIKCLGRNMATDLHLSEPSSDVTFLRVKAKTAALWPFLGICAEVLTLCTIILIYERKRSKTELEDMESEDNEK